MLADTTLVIPQRNREELTLACLQSMYVHEPSRYPALVIDDGSAPGAVRFVEVMDSRAAVIRQPPRGLTSAWNLAMKFVRTPYVVFLNNDVVWNGPSLDRLLAPLREGTALISAAAERHETRLPPDVLARLPLRQFAEGWCFALRRADLERIGGFDETMQLYWSDTDLQLRLHAAWREAPLFSGRDVPPVFLSVARTHWRHLGHQTAHAMPEHATLWKRDRNAFLRKWKL